MKTTSLKAARLCASAFVAIGLGASAARAGDPGVTPTSVTIGQTVPLSGPVSAYATFSRATSAYFDMVNAQGGIAGRKINLLSVDDSFSPPKTVDNPGNSSGSGRGTRTGRSSGRASKRGWLIWSPQWRKEHRSWCSFVEIRLTWRCSGPRTAPAVFRISTVQRAAGSAELGR